MRMRVACTPSDEILYRAAGYAMRGSGCLEDLCEWLLENCPRILEVLARGELWRRVVGRRRGAEDSKDGGGKDSCSARG